MNGVYSHLIDLRSRDCDFTGRWKPSEIFVAMQELGAGHSDGMGADYDYMLSHSLAFALTRMELRMDSYPVLGQKVVGKTWVTPVMKWLYPRHFLFETEDGRVLGRASSLWVLMDLNQRKMINPQALGVPLEVGDLPAPMPMPGKVAPAPANCECRQHLPAYGELDINGHVNNTRYVAWACDALGVERLKHHYVSRLAVNYSHEILPGRSVTLRSLAQGDEFHLSGEIDSVQHFALEGTLAPDDQR